MYFSSGKERSIVLNNLNTNLILTTKTKSNNLVKVLFLIKKKTRVYSAYTNNEINWKKITKPIRGFQLSLGGQHIVKLTTSLFAPKYYLRFISLVGYTLYLVDN